VTPRRAAVALAAVAVWLVSWTLLHHFFWGGSQIIDTPVYESYGDAMRAGKVPYRDFTLEYPPAALPAFLAPELTAKPHDFGSYGHSFEKWMAGCGVVMVLLCALVLALLRVPERAAAASLALVALSPLLLGNLFLSRFDLWPATLAVGAIAALLGGRDLLGAGVLGVAVSAKLWPAVFVPLGLAWVWRRRGVRAAALWAAVVVAVVAAIFLPFVALSPAGVGHALGTQAGRPLQIESLGAALLVWAHHVFGVAIAVRSDHGSQNVEGSAADAVGALTIVLQIAAVVGVWILHARGPSTPARLVCAAAAAVAAFVGFGKVFSPQFMVWLVPLVPLVPLARGAAGRAASALLVAALVLTQWWFPYRYWRLPLQLDKTVAGAVLLRDLAVVAIALVLLGALRQPRSKPT
jgi:Glycosyltransferase family 87